MARNLDGRKNLDDGTHISPNSALRLSSQIDRNEQVELYIALLKN